MVYVPLIDREDYTEDVASPEVADKKLIKRSISSNVSFDAEDLDNFIISRGIPTLWQQAFICPCIDPDTHQPDPLCPICHGTYRGYLPAIKDTYVAIQSQNRGTTRSKDFGNLDLGTAQGTFRANAQINVMDRITVPDLTTRQNFVFTVTEDRFNSGFYIPYDIRKILYIVSYKNNELTNLIEHSDYEYNSAEHKIYILNKDLIDSNVSLILNITVRYIITNMLRDTRYQYDSVKKFTTQLPKLALLQRESVLINNTPLAPKSDSDMEQDLNSALSQEGIKIVTAEKNSSFGLGDI
jgi:hypothetical protein